MSKGINADKAVVLMQFYLASWDAGHVDPKNRTMLHKEIDRIARRTGKSSDAVWMLVENEARRLGWAGLKRV